MGVIVKVVKFVKEMITSVDEGRRAFCHQRHKCWGSRATVGRWATVRTDREVVGCHRHRPRTANIDLDYRAGLKTRTVGADAVGCSRRYVAADNRPRIHAGYAAIVQNSSYTLGSADRQRGRCRFPIAISLAPGEVKKLKTSCIVRGQSESDILGRFS